MPRRSLLLTQGRMYQATKATMRPTGAQGEIRSSVRAIVSDDEDRGWEVGRVVSWMSGKRVFVFYAMDIT